MYVSCSFLLKRNDFIHMLTFTKVFFYFFFLYLVCYMLYVISGVISAYCSSRLVKSVAVWHDLSRRDLLICIRDKASPRC